MKNALFYPESFPAAELTTTSNGIEATVNLIEYDLRATAIRTLYGRRQVFQSAIRNENRDVRIIADFMPLKVLGTAAQVASNRTLGTKAFVAAKQPAGNSVDVISLQVLSVSPAGFNLTRSRFASACFCSGQRGYLSGGMDWYQRVDQIRREQQVERGKWVQQ